MEPMEVLCQIVAADRQAREAFRLAQGQDRDLDGQINRLRREMSCQALDKAKKDVAAAKDAAVAEARSAMDELEDQYARELAALTERYESRREETAERMFRMTVGLE